MPGAGLGRLCTEIARRGYACQGNEYSYFMLLTSSFMLNCVDRKEAVGIFPWVRARAVASPRESMETISNRPSCAQVLNTCNNREHKDQLRQVLIPDEARAGFPSRCRSCSAEATRKPLTLALAHSSPSPGPAALQPTVEMNLPPGSLSMCAGDFVEVYSTPDNAEAFDAVVTCFFIDTAHNVAACVLPQMRPPAPPAAHSPAPASQSPERRVCATSCSYLEVIWHALRPGGVWINHGPLLWHWADAHTYLSTPELSIEVPLESVLRCAAALGFL